jgi:hypothetical protein
MPKRSESADAADQKLVARSDVADGIAASGATARKISVSPDEAPAGTLPESRKPVLVVFEFTEPASDHI